MAMVERSERGVEKPVGEIFGPAALWVSGLWLSLLLVSLLRWWTQRGERQRSPSVWQWFRLARALLGLLQLLVEINRGEKSPAD